MTALIAPIEDDRRSAGGHLALTGSRDFERRANGHLEN